LGVDARVGLRWLSIAAGFVAGALVASKSRAEDCAPEGRLQHRVALGAGYAAVYLNAGTDGHYTIEGPRANGQLGYRYSPERGLEVGADFVLFSSPAPVLLPAAMIGGHLPIGPRDVVEIGLSWHLGMMIVPYRSRTSTGWGTWAGIDVRVWATERFGVQIGGQAFAGKGSKPSAEDVQADPYLGTLGFLSAGGALSALMRL
jgi:hypothetical protein